MDGGRFHGRVRGSQKSCAHPTCADPGEFRAPNPYGASPSANGPGDWLWFCLPHVREFNARYDYFSGLTREQIEEAQMPAAGWATETRAFASAGVDAPPSWANFADPLEAISARFRDGVARASKEGQMLPPEDRAALKTLGLDTDANRKSIRAAYTKLARAFHPDRNGGDRRFEKKLHAVITAYQKLQSSALWR